MTEEVPFPGDDVDRVAEVQLTEFTLTYKDTAILVANKGAMGWIMRPLHVFPAWVEHVKTYRTDEKNFAAVQHLAFKYAVAIEEIKRTYDAWEQTSIELMSPFTPAEPENE